MFFFLKLRGFTHNIGGEKRVLLISDQVGGGIFGGSIDQEGGCIPTFLINDCETNDVIKLLASLQLHQDLKGNLIKNGSVILFYSWSMLRNSGSACDYLNKLRALKYQIGSEVYGFFENGEPRVRLVPTILPSPLKDTLDRNLFSDLAECLKLGELSGIIG